MKSLRAFVAAESLLLFALSAPPLLAQAPPINYQSTEIHPDHTITFRYKDAGATKVMLNIRDLPKQMAMEKGADGVWTVTTQPLPPAIYNYIFLADGESRLDPANPHVAIKFQNVTNLLTVTGSSPQPWESTNVPHGELHHHFYNSSVVLNLPNNQSDYYVYTPPGYNPAAKTLYPVLYLLHGFNEGAYSWTAVGKANFILDNLLAQGKIKPMIVVMPLGYGDLNYIHSPIDVWHDPTSIDHNTELYTKAFLNEVMPR